MGFFIRYIILYGVYMTLLVAVIVNLMLLRALIFYLAFIGFCGQSDEGYAMCRHNEWLYRLFFMGDVPDAPYPCSHYLSASHKQTISIDLGRGGACSSRVVFAQPLGGEEMNGFSIPR